MQMRKQTIALAMALGVMMPAVSGAALVASDNAADAAYSSGWNYGTNGGTGFQPWTGGAGGASIGVIGNSASTEYPGGTPIATSGKAWAISPPAGDVVFATRALTANSGSGVGSLDVGQSLAMDFDNGYGNNGEVGVKYLGSDGSVRFTFTTAWWGESLSAGGSSMQVVGSATARIGAHSVLTLGEGNTYSLAVTTNLASTPVTQTFTGTLGGTPDSGIVTLSFFKAGNLENWGLPNYQRAFNSLAVTAVPEPVSLALLGLGGFALLARRRRHA